MEPSEGGRGRVLGAGGPFAWSPPPLPGRSSPSRGAASGRGSAAASADIVTPQHPGGGLGTPGRASAAALAGQAAHGQSGTSAAAATGTRRGLAGQGPGPQTAQQKDGRSPPAARGRTVEGQTISPAAAQPRDSSSPRRPTPKPHSSSKRASPGQQGGRSESPNKQGAACKVCNRCGHRKQLGDFLPEEGLPGGLAACCTACVVSGKAPTARKTRVLVMEPVVSQKECRRCHTTKPAAEFHCCRTHSDGLDTYCKACQALISAERRQRQIRVDVPTVDHKICRQCAVDKPAGDFNRNRNNPDGLASYCRVCRAKNENVAGTATRYKRHVPEPPPQVTVPTEPGPVTAYTPRSASKMRRRKGPKSAMGDGGRQSQSTSPTSTGAAAPAQDTSPHARSLHSPGSVDAAEAPLAFTARRSRSPRQQRGRRPDTLAAAQPGAAHPHPQPHPQNLQPHTHPPALLQPTSTPVHRGSAQQPMAVFSSLDEFPGPQLRPLRIRREHAPAAAAAASLGLPVGRQGTVDGAQAEQAQRSRAQHSMQHLGSALPPAVLQRMQAGVQAPGSPASAATESPTSYLASGLNNHGDSPAQQNLQQAAALAAILPGVVQQLMAAQGLGSNPHSSSSALSSFLNNAATDSPLSAKSAPAVAAEDAHVAMQLNHQRPGGNAGGRQQQGSSPQHAGHAQRGAQQRSAAAGLSHNVARDIRAGLARSGGLFRGAQLGEGHSADDAGSHRQEAGPEGAAAEGGNRAHHAGGSGTAALPRSLLARQISQSLLGPSGSVQRAALHGSLAPAAGGARAVQQGQVGIGAVDSFIADQLSALFSSGGSTVEAQLGGATLTPQPGATLAGSGGSLAAALAKSGLLAGLTGRTETVQMGEDGFAMPLPRGAAAALQQPAEHSRAAAEQAAGAAARTSGSGRPDPHPQAAVPEQGQPSSVEQPPSARFLQPGRGSFGGHLGLDPTDLDWDPAYTGLGSLPLEFNLQHTLSRWPSLLRGCSSVDSALLADMYSGSGEMSALGSLSDAQFAQLTGGQTRLAHSISDLNSALLAHSAQASAQGLAAGSPLQRSLSASRESDPPAAAHPAAAAPLGASRAGSQGKPTHARHTRLTGQSRADSEPSRLRRPRPVALRPVGGSLDATLLGGPQHTHRDPSWLPLGLHKRRLPQQGSGSVGDNDSGGGGSGGPPLKHGSGSGTLGSLNSGSSASAFRPYGPSPRSHPRKRVKVPHGASPLWRQTSTVDSADAAEGSGAELAGHAAVPQGHAGPSRHAAAAAEAVDAAALIPSGDTHLLHAFAEVAAAHAAADDDELKQVPDAAGNPGDAGKGRSDPGHARPAAQQPMAAYSEALHVKLAKQGSGLASETRSDDPGSAASAETPITWKTGKARTPRSRLRVSRT